MSAFLRILHVGGRQDTIGPATLLLEKMGPQIELTVCDASSSIENAGLNQDFAKRYRTTLITRPYCIAAESGHALFFEATDPDASGLRVFDADRRFYWRDGRRWSDDCMPRQATMIETRALSDLAFQGNIQPPHVLSLDIQGVEYEVLESYNDDYLNLVAVVTEAEFRPLYKGQKLFADIDQLLRSRRFILADLYSPHRWQPHYGYPVGAGFLTVAEPLYLRDYRLFTGPERLDAGALARLIAVSAAFGQLSYAYEVLRAAQEVVPTAFMEAVDRSLCPYLQKVITLLDKQLVVGGQDAP